jgi:psp operon transcriptional activator
MPQFSPEAVRSMENHHWPGNVRELKNVVERAVYRSESSLIGEIVFDPFSSPYNTKPPEMARQAAGAGKTSPGSENLMAKPLKEALWELKVRMLELALEKAKFNQKKAAQLLGLTYHQFRGLYRQYRKNDEPSN